MYTSLTIHNRFLLHKPKILISANMFETTTLLLRFHARKLDLASTTNYIHRLAALVTIAKAEFWRYSSRELNRVEKLAYNNINLAAGQLQIVTWCAWLVSLNDGEKESKTQLAPSAKVCSLASFSILTGYARLCLVIPRQTTSKQKELTLFTENGLPTMQMTNIKFF